MAELEISGLFVVGGPDDALRDSIVQLFAPLSFEEKFILTSRLGLRNGSPATLNELAERAGLTRERIRQIECGAKQKIARDADQIALTAELLKNAGMDEAAAAIKLVSA